MNELTPLRLTYSAEHSHPFDALIGWWKTGCWIEMYSWRWVIEALKSWPSPVIVTKYRSYLGNTCKSTASALKLAKCKRKLLLKMAELRLKRFLSAAQSIDWWTASPTQVLRENAFYRNGVHHPDLKLLRHFIQIGWYLYCDVERFRSFLAWFVVFTFQINDNVCNYGVK